MHAVLCTSAVHLANWALKVNDQVKGVHFAEQAAQHRAQALHCLRVSSAKNDELDEEMNAATMILLIVSGVRSLGPPTCGITPGRELIIRFYEEIQT